MSDVQFLLIQRNVNKKKKSVNNFSDDIYIRFVNFCREHDLISKGDSVLVAISGGADSVALLDLLRRWKDEGTEFWLSAAHFNHKIRNESDSDLKDVQRICRALNVECFTGEGQVETAGIHQKRAVHDIAREMRYDFLMDVANQKCCRDDHHEKLPLIATGHHLDDQVETLLMRLFSGGGIEGLAGIRRSLDFGEPPHARLIRPLLGFRHEELISYCQEKPLRYVEDMSNYDNTYPRNRIRHKLVPSIVDLFGESALQGISRSADHAGHASVIINHFTEKAYKDALLERRECDIVLDYHIISSYLIGLRYNCLLKAARELTTRQTRFTYERIKTAEKRLINRYKGITELGDGVSTCVHHDRIWIFRQPRNLLPIQLICPGSYDIPDWGRLELKAISPDQKEFPPPEGRLFLDLDVIGTNEISIEPAGSGDRFQPLGMTGHRKVSDFLSEIGVPIHRRRYPVIRAKSQIAAIPPFQIAERYKISPRTKRVLKIQWTDC